MFVIQWHVFILCWQCAFSVMTLFLRVFSFLSWEAADGRETQRAGSLAWRSRLYSQWRPLSHSQGWVQLAPTTSGGQGKLFSFFLPTGACFLNTDYLYMYIFSLHSSSPLLCIVGCFGCLTPTYLNPTTLTTSTYCIFTVSPVASMLCKEYVIYEGSALPLARCFLSTGVLNLSSIKINNGFVCEHFSFWHWSKAQMSNSRPRGPVSCSFRCVLDPIQLI